MTDGAYSPAAKYVLRRLRSMYQYRIGRDRTSIVRVNSAGIGRRIILIRSPPQRLDQDVTGPCSNNIPAMLDEAAGNWDRAAAPCYVRGTTTTSD